jgi:hypothetical protein
MITTRWCLYNMAKRLRVSGDIQDTRDITMYACDHPSPDSYRVPSLARRGSPSTARTGVVFHEREGLIAQLSYFPFVHKIKHTTR